MARGFTKTELLAAAATLGVVSCVVLAGDGWTQTQFKLNASLCNLAQIGKAIGQYQHDNANHVPDASVYDLSGSFTGWTSWTWGGKNCSTFWGTNVSFADVYASKRTLNHYVHPDRTFPPLKSHSDPDRALAKAEGFFDAADALGHQESWPQSNKNGLSCYDDVGTSYMTEMVWFRQIEAVTPGHDWFKTMKEGQRRLAVTQGVDPARFVLMADEFADLVLYQGSTTAKVTANHGAINKADGVFYDGHAALIEFLPGGKRAQFITPTYSVWFEDIAGRGGEGASHSVPAKAPAVAQGAGGLAR